MPKFIATPHLRPAQSPEFAPATGLKTALQVGVPIANYITVCEWGCCLGLDAAVGGAVLMEGGVAASGGTSLTPDKWDVPDGPASICVGGAALTASASGGAFTENTIAASRFFDSQKVHPQTGYSVWFPSDARPTASSESGQRATCGSG